MIDTLPDDPVRVTELEKAWPVHVQVRGAMRFVAVAGGFAIGSSPAVLRGACARPTLREPRRDPPHRVVERVTLAVIQGAAANLARA